MYYKRYIKSCIAVMSGVCCCCRLFVSLSSLVIVLRSEPIIVTALDNDTIIMAFFDYYSQEIDEYQFYYLCFNILKQKKVPKFSFVNKVNIVICQNYPPALEAFTLVKKMLITWYYLVISILKL